MDYNNYCCVLLCLLVRASNFATLFMWCCYVMVWDVTCPDTMPPAIYATLLPGPGEPGAVANRAETLKKYSDISAIIPDTLFWWGLRHQIVCGE